MISYKTIVDLHKQPNKTGSFIQKYIFNRFAIPLTYLFVNKFPLHPNVITFIGFILYSISLYALFNNFLLIGFIFYWSSFIFDIVDGNVARLTKKTSLVGAYIDILLDWIKPSFVYLFLFFLTSQSLLLCLIIINFLAAGSWRIYLNILPSESNTKKELLENNNSKYRWMSLPFISAIEVEFMVIGCYLYSFNDIWLYMALLVRLKDFAKNTLSSLIKLYKIDKNKK